MSDKKIKPPSSIVPLLVLLILLSVPIFGWAQTYVEPNGPPPLSAPQGRPALEYLNGSSGEQRKLGSLIIGERNGRLTNCTNTDTSGCSRLCLNGDPAQGANDPDCIRDWSDIADFIGGPFLRLLNSSQTTEVDPGFVSLRSYPYNGQLISLIAEANPNIAGSGGIKAESTSTSHYAAQFAGRVAVDQPTGNAKLCLHGVCITSWSNAVAPPSDSVWLQNVGPYTQQSGHLSLSGLIIAGSVVAGAPTAATPTSYTCGDGLCSQQNNEAAVCPLDCT